MASNIRFLFWGVLGFFNEGSMQNFLKNATGFNNSILKKTKAQDLV